MTTLRSEIIRPNIIGVAVLLLSTSLAGCAPRSAATMSVPPPAGPPAGMQYLYGSGEAAALSEQAYNALLDYVIGRMLRQKAGTPAAGDHFSAVLVPGSTLEEGKMLPCGDKPPAVIFDVDETLLLNLGFEYDDAMHPGRAYDDGRWLSWEQTGVDAVAPVPGALETVKALRTLGVAVIFNTNRNASTARYTEAAIDHAGLGPARHGDTLWLKGDVAPGSGKDPRRAAIAARYCVWAMGGDQLGDFSDLFTGNAVARRALAQVPATGGRFGRIWFVLPNPVYGTGLQGGFDDIFPAEKRWATPATKELN